MSKKTIYALLSLLFPLTLFSQSGSLDASFNGDGTDEWDFGINGLEIAYSGYLQPDGKFLIAGWSSINGKPDYAVVRYTSSGERDASFGNQGLVLADFNAASDRCQTITVQPDGKIILAGSTDISSKTDFSLLRLNTDGRPDSTFGANGWVITDLGTDFEFANVVAVQDDGKIILAGSIAEGFFSDFAMVRYTHEGKIDSLFGNDGIVITDFREEDKANDIILQPDGKIILAGFSSESATGDFALARYNPDGTPDKFFGVGGKVQTDLEGANDSDFINEAILLDDGRILAAGNANNNNLEFTSDAGMVRYMPDGSVDESFGTNGILIKPFGSKTNIEGLTVQPDGKILLCGQSDLVFGQNQWLITRFFDNGSTDTTFGDFGIVTTPMNGNSSFPGTIIVQPDSKIIVGGSAGMSPNFNFAAARYIADFKLSFTVSGLSCFGANDGLISVEADGGIAPYTYSIDGGASFQPDNTFDMLAPGTYYITIRDANTNGASSTIGPIEIMDPASPPVVFVETEDDNNIIFIHVQGEAIGFQFSIDGGLSFTADSVFTDLEDGLYHVVVLDEMGCIIHEQQVLISTLSTFDSDHKTELVISPNPTRGILNIDLDFENSSFGNVGIYDLTGKLIQILPMTIMNDHQVRVDVRSLSDGWYVLKVQTSRRMNFGRFLLVK